MTAPGPRSQFVTRFLIAGGCLLAACGGGGGGDAATPAPVTVSGVVTFDLVPVVPGSGVGAGLDYAATVAAPARGVTVEFDDGSAVVASTRTDAAGRYALRVPANRTGRVRVLAETVAAGPPGWDVRVVDNTNSNALYSLEGTDRSTGTADSVRDLHAASGWTGGGYGAPRAAAPFAILDTIRDGMDLIAASDASVTFPPLVVHWSENNIPSLPQDGIDIAAGEIVSTFYSPSRDGIFVLGAADADTDEYDRHVLLHEWGHYVEHALARSDTIGGPHGLGDVLDMRLAFSEGWSNAFAAIAAGNSVYSDVQGPGQTQAPSIDVEGPVSIFLPNPAPGWFSEQSVHEILYDFVDAAVDGSDSISMPFGSLYTVLTGDYGTGVPLTSLFSFVDELKRNNPAEGPIIDDILADQSVMTATALADPWGTGEANDAGTSPATVSDVLPVYHALTVGAPPIEVCSTDEFASPSTDLVNKLGTRQLIRFDIAAAGPTTISAVATSVPANAFADPDFVLHAGGVYASSEDEPSAQCMNTGAGTWLPADCAETLSLTLDAGAYVLDVYEYTNTLARTAVTPPIGRTCFAVSVAQP